MRLEGTFSEVQPKTIDVQFEEDLASFYGEFGQIQVVKEFVGGNPYNGEYSVTPKVDSQTMETKGKVMEDNVTITAIPFFEVSNTSGGNTVYIAEEI